MMPLLVAPIGANLNVKRVLGDENVRKHLEALGIVPERQISVLSRTKNGVIIQVSDSRLALDNAIARNIFVGL